jgi:L-2-hydroxycarboxylate dehydrogenase (NAD+)
MSSAEHPAVERVSERDLYDFTNAVLRAIGLGVAAAEVTARVLVASDVRGIASHGVARLAYYVTMIETGAIDPRAAPVVVRESATTAVRDARNGMGHPVGVQAMTLAMDKAARHDTGIITVRQSNHYGIAGYYAMLALERDMIGLSLTNTHPVVAPTGGRQPTYGTNPIAIAVPTAGSVPFVLDMATSVVPRGRLEVAARRHVPLALGWALDAQGRETTNPEDALAGALLPLGGGVLTSGYKGYGLATAIEILAAVLPGALYGPLVSPMWTEGSPSNLGQFFMAINVAAFDDPPAFKERVRDLLQRLKESPRADDAMEILVAGEKEQRATIAARAQGVPLDDAVVSDLIRIADRYDVPAPSGLRAAAR